MAHEHAVLAQAYAPVTRKGAEPSLVRVRGVDERVLVADAREVVVARIGVAAAAVGLALRERLVVVALDGEDAVILQQGEHPVRVRAEAAHVTEAEHRLDAAMAGVLERRVERERVVVDAAEDRDAPVLGYPFLHVIPVSWQVTHEGW